MVLLLNWEAHYFPITKFHKGALRYATCSTRHSLCCWRLQHSPPTVAQTEGRRGREGGGGGGGAREREREGEGEGEGVDGKGRRIGAETHDRSRTDNIRHPHKLITAHSHDFLTVSLMTSLHALFILLKVMEGGGWRRVEEGGGGLEEGGGGWRWVEVGGGGWRRVEVGGGGWVGQNHSLGAAETSW